MRKSILTLVGMLIFATSFSQSFYDQDNIQSIKITFTQSNWDALLDAEKAGAGNYIMAQSVEVNGISFDSVGVKYKGNSTYSANQIKNPFHIELDTYKDHEYDGYTDIKLSNVAKDPSFIREVLSYDILRNYMDAPLSNYANVYVNGNLMGLYSNSESISKKFVNNRFGSKTNTFVKCNPPAGAGPGVGDYPDLVYLGQDSTNYYAGYELKSDNGWQELIDLCDELENNISGIESILDVDRALWMLAFNNALVNLDSYIGSFTQNYYLYRDDNGRFLPVVWDLNESFGRFANTGSGSLNNTAAKQQMDHLLHSSDADFPLISQLLSVPTYKKRYLAHVKTILEDNFTNNGSYYTKGQQLQTVIDGAVQADPNKFFTYANFTDNLTSDVISGGGPGGGATPGITSLMNGRYSYLMGLSDFTATEPTISAVTLSDPTPSFNSVVTVSANVVDEDEVYLGYRAGVHLPFVKVQMFDDGLHNDGAANDNVFGADMTMQADVMQYYIYAENSTIGKFSPTNAEHEFHTATAAFDPIGDVVINEFLASNDTAIADQDGEFDDWLELYNKGTQAVDISGYHLSDDVDELDLYTFPANTVLNANEYLIVWADKDLSQAGYHADFKLSAAGETIFLSDSSMTELDVVTYPEQATDTSYGRFVNGTGDFQIMLPTFGAMNTNDLGVGILDINSVSSTLSAYPNPANEFFTLELSDATQNETNVLVYDIHGKLIHQQAMQQKITIDSSGWSSGFYFLVVGENRAKLVIH